MKHKNFNIFNLTKFKNNLILIVFIAIISCPRLCVFAQSADPSSKAETKSPQIDGKYEIIRNFDSKVLGNSRDVIVLLPESYETAKAGKSSQKNYPVLYMHDGNNLFDPKTSFLGLDWGVDETVNKLAAEGKIDEIIVVGIYNTPARNSEYTPFRDPKHGGGDGDKYIRFIIDELKPEIDRKYRTKKGAADTAIGGSSLGGLVSLYAGLRYPQTFGKMIVMSPSAWWAGGEIIGWTAKQKIDASKLRLWLDMGLAEDEEGLVFVRKLAKTVGEKYPGAAGFRYSEFPGAQHNEAAWRARFERPLVHLFKKGAGN